MGIFQVTRDNFLFLFQNSALGSWVYTWGANYQYLFNISIQRNIEWFELLQYWSRPFGPSNLYRPFANQTPQIHFSPSPCKLLSLKHFPCFYLQKHYLFCFTAFAGNEPPLSLQWFFWGKKSFASQFKSDFFCCWTIGKHSFYLRMFIAQKEAIWSIRSALDSYQNFQSHSPSLTA